MNPFNSDRLAEHLHGWRAHLWNNTKYRGISLRQARDLIDKEPDLYAVFCAIERMRR